MNENVRKRHECHLKTACFNLIDFWSNAFNSSKCARLLQSLFFFLYHVFNEKESISCTPKRSGFNKKPFSTLTHEEDQTIFDNTKWSPFGLFSTAREIFTNKHCDTLCEKNDKYSLHLGASCIFRSQLKGFNL